MHECSPMANPLNDLEVQKRRQYRMATTKQANLVVKRAQPKSYDCKYKGCFAGLMRFITGFQSGKHAKIGHEGGLAQADAEACRESAHTIGTRLFGQSKRDMSSGADSMNGTSLYSAQIVIDRRIACTQSKMDELRAQAKVEHTKGQRAVAIRILKRAKACERQLTTLSNASTAIDRQAEMLAEASLQREVANAIAGSMTSMQGAKKLLAGVDRLSDDVADMRDISDDVQQALASIADSSNDNGPDDDELLAELCVMADSPTKEAVCSTSVKLEDAERLFPTAPSFELSKLSQFPSRPASLTAAAH